MFTVIYNAKAGICYPDGVCEEKVLEHYEYSTTRHYTICVSSQLYVSWVRAHVKLGTIPLKDVCIMFDGIELEMTKDGKLKEWPTGFCQGHSEVLRILNRVN